MSFTMTDLRVTPPEPVELVSAAEAASLIAEVDRELAALERRAAEARETADAVQARAEREGADEGVSTWAIVRLQRFIDGLRVEAERDAETVVEAARRGAREQSDARLADDARWRHALLPVVRPAPPDPVAEAPGTMAAPVVAPVGGTAVESAPVGLEPGPEPEPRVQDVSPVPEASVSWAPLSPERPTTNGHTPEDGAPAANAVPVAAPPLEPPPVIVPAVANAPVEVAVPVTPAPAPAPIAARPAPKKRFLRGFPLSAVLEVLAVLLVLLFILLRLS
jgi:hypothetical protein